MAHVHEKFDITNWKLYNYEIIQNRILNRSTFNLQNWFFCLSVCFTVLLFFGLNCKLLFCLICLQSVKGCWQRDNFLKEFETYMAASNILITAIDEKRTRDVDYLITHCDAYKNDVDRLGVALMAVHLSNTIEPGKFCLKWKFKNVKLIC